MKTTKPNQKSPQTNVKRNVRSAKLPATRVVSRRTPAYSATNLSTTTFLLLCFSFGSFTRRTVNKIAI